MGGNAATNEALKERMADALIDLLQAKGIDKVTITEITEHANVGRMSFFRNFNSKEDLLTFKITLLWERWADAHSMRERKRFDFANALDFFNFNLSIAPLLECMYRNGLQYALYNAFYLTMVPEEFDDSDGSALTAYAVERYESCFYAQALYGLLDEWIQRGFRETPDEMLQISQHIIHLLNK